MLTYIWLYIGIGFILMCLLDYREGKQDRHFSFLQFTMGMLFWPIFLVAAIAVSMRSD